MASDDPVYRIVIRARSSEFMITHYTMTNKRIVAVADPDTDLVEIARKAFEAPARDRVGQPTRQLSVDTIEALRRLMESHRGELDLGYEQSTEYALSTSSSH